MNDLRRYARQMIVAGVGEDGQRRILEAQGAVAGVGLSHEVATSYASRAGITRIAPGEIDPALAPEFLELAAPRAIVAGSRAALAVLRAAIDGSSEGTSSGRGNT